MELKGETIALALSGAPVKISSCNIAVIQPKVKDVCVFGEDRFLFDVQLLSKTEQFVQEIKMGNSELDIIPDFNILLIMISQDEETKKNIKEFLDFIFPGYLISITQTEISFKIEEKIVGQINATNFKDFQSIIHLLFLPNTDRDGEIEYNPEGDKAKEITEKILAGRRKLQQQKSNQKEGKKESLFALYTSILAVGLRMDINTFMMYTPFQLFDSLNRFFKKNAEDYYTRLSTTPFMDVSKIEAPPSWIENLY